MLPVILPTRSTLTDLYLQDETAWLEAMSERLRSGRIEDANLEDIAGYLSDMG